MLEDLPPVEFRENSKALSMFRKRLEPLFGAELIDRRRGLAQSTVSGIYDPDSPFHNILLGKLAHRNGFFFVDYTPASHQTES